jgi:NAD(P)H-dependent FMN reductase
MGLNETVGRRLLLISGSLRTASTNTAVLRTLAAVVPADIDCWIYDHLEDLPPFNPDADRPPLPPEVTRLREAVHRADAIIFSTPEYAGALPGAFKNLLDWTIGDDQPRSIYDKPVGWINASPREAAGAYGELRVVLGYAHARIAEAACIQVPITTAMIGPDGLIDDSASRAALSRLAEPRAWSADPACHDS